MSSADDLKAQGNAAFAAKQYDTAISLFSQAIDTSSSPNHILFSNRSACHAALRQFDEALSDAQECVKIKPDWSKGHGRVGAALHGLGRLPESVAAYEQALVLDPNNAQAKSGLEAAQRALENPGPSSGPGAEFAAMFADANVWPRLDANPSTKDFSKDPAFVAKFRQVQQNPMGALTQMGSDPRIAQAIGVVLGVDVPGTGPGTGPGADSEQSKPDHTESEESEKEAKKEPAQESKKEQQESKQEDSDPAKTQADALKTEANALYKAHEFDRAIDLYNQAWETYHDITYLNNRAAAEFEKGDFAATVATCTLAIDHGREVFADYKLMAKAYARCGNAYLKLEDLPNAIEMFNKSLTEHRTPDVLNKLRATEKELRKREELAYQDPVKAEEARELGNSHFKAGQWPEAVKAYGEAVKRAPKDPRGYANRAAALLKLLSYPDAIKDCDQAIELDANFFKAYTRKATALLVMKEYRKCLTTLDQARRVDVEHKHTREIDELYQKAMQGRFQAQEGETPEQTLERASQDPEIVEILQDPIMNSILQQAQQNPAALADHMKNPEVRTKIDLLVAAGIIRTR